MIDSVITISWRWKYLRDEHPLTPLWVALIIISCATRSWRTIPSVNPNAGVVTENKWSDQEENPNDQHLSPIDTYHKAPSIPMAAFSISQPFASLSSQKVYGVNVNATINTARSKAKVIRWINATSKIGRVNPPKIAWVRITATMDQTPWKLIPGRYGGDYRCEE